MIKLKHTKPKPTNTKSWQCRCGAINDSGTTECKRISIDKIRLIKSVEAGRWVK